jgi:crotonobetainyl-CoA:carnitine CoA-transferase CaiB-like acyl-CoA transferase
MVRAVKRPDEQKARIIASPVRMFRSPLQLPELPPRLGEYNEQVTCDWPD